MTRNDHRSTGSAGRRVAGEVVEIDVDLVHGHPQWVRPQNEQHQVDLVLQRLAQHVLVVEVGVAHARQVDDHEP